MKRKRADAHPPSSTPKMARNRDDHVEDDLIDDLTPLPSTYSTPSKSAKKIKGILINGATPTPKSNRVATLTNGDTATPKSHRRVLFATPAKPPENQTVDESPSATNKADRSAQRKSARRLLERATAGGDSEDDDFSDEDELARQILGEDAADVTSEPGVGGDDAGSDVEEEAEIAVTVPDTPSKRPRGRPRKSDAERARKTKRRTPTPPGDLPPHERYFYDNRPGGGAKATSNNTLASHDLLSHDEYNEEMAAYHESHESQSQSLLQNHALAFEQWMFELRNGFHICLYGYGSKRQLVNDFAHHLYDDLFVHPAPSNKKNKQPSPPTPNIVVVNGYNPDIVPRDVLTTLLLTIVPQTTKLPLQPAALLSQLFSELDKIPASHFYMLINSIDAPPFRRSAFQSIITTLASHPQLSIIATADTPTFPLIWNSSHIQHQHHHQPHPHNPHRRKDYQPPKWLYHDATTFVPLTTEASGAGAFDAVETVNELLGRGGRRGVSGRDGVGFVLRSLPENARALYRMLVAEQLAATDADADGPGLAPGAGAQAGDEDDEPDGTAGGEGGGVEWSVLYRKAVEEFVCSNEMTFRTLLKEFYDHRMVESRRDALGSETLVAPFRREELEGLLEELVGL